MLARLRATTATVHFALLSPEEGRTCAVEGVDVIATRGVVAARRACAVVHVVLATGTSVAGGTEAAVARVGEDSGVRASCIRLRPSSRGRVRQTWRLALWSLGKIL